MLLTLKKQLLSEWCLSDRYLFNQHMSNWHLCNQHLSDRCLSNWRCLTDVLLFCYKCFSNQCLSDQYIKCVICYLGKPLLRNKGQPMYIRSRQVSIIYNSQPLGPGKHHYWTNIFWANVCRTKVTTSLHFNAHAEKTKSFFSYQNNIPKRLLVSRTYKKKI